MKVIKVNVPFEFHRFLSGLKIDNFSVKYVDNPESKEKSPVFVIEKEMDGEIYPQKTLYQFQIYAKS